MLRSSIIPYIILVLMIGFGCKKESTDCRVTIDIVKPADNMQISDAADVDVQISFNATAQRLAEITIRMFPESDPTDLIISDSENPNTQTHNTFYNHDLSGYPSATLFRIEVVACCGENTCDFTAQKNSTFQIP